MIFSNLILDSFSWHFCAVLQAQSLIQADQELFFRFKQLYNKSYSDHEHVHNCRTAELQAASSASRNCKTAKIKNDWSGPCVCRTRASFIKPVDLINVGLEALVTMGSGVCMEAVCVCVCVCVCA